MNAPSDVALIERVIDAAHVVDDFVRGVLELGAGRIGRSDEPLRRFTQRLLGAVRPYGEKEVVRGMAAMYGPEQLRKAANHANDLTEAIQEFSLSARSEPARAAVAQVADIGVREVGEILRRPEVGSRSPELAEVHERLHRTIAVLNEARTKVILADMRGS